MDDLFAPLAPPKEDVERRVGEIRGLDLDRIGAGAQAWCGLHLGWRDLGPARIGAVVRSIHGRVMVGICFDCGEAPAPAPRGAAAEEEERGDG